MHISTPESNNEYILIVLELWTFDKGDNCGCHKDSFDILLISKVAS
jgi:hypothetical protein